MKSARSYHVYPSPITHESRIAKEALTLEKLVSGVKKVVVLGVLAPGLSEVEESQGGFVSIHRFPLAYSLSVFPRLLRLLGYWRWLRSVKAFLLEHVTADDVIHCHSLAVLSACVSVRGRVGCKLLYDAHELESERAGAGAIRRCYSRNLERKLLPSVDAMWVVGESIQNWYFDHMGVTAKVIYNCPMAQVRLPDGAGDESFREQFSVPSEAVLYLYQGSMSHGRGIDKLLSAFSLVDPAKAHLILMGYGPLSASVLEFSARHNNIHYVDAVAPEVVLSYTRLADVGVATIEPICLSYQYCLPNKLFEYMHAGLGVLVTDLPDMGKVVRKYECGAVLDPHASVGHLADVITGISHDTVSAWKLKSQEALSNYTWENQEGVIVSTYHSLLKKG